MSELREVVVKRGEEIKGFKTVKRENGWEEIKGFKTLKKGDVIKVDGKNTEWLVESDPFQNEGGILTVLAKEKERDS